MTRTGRFPEEDGEGRLPDATRRNWVDTHCPNKLRPFLRLSRLDRPIGSWLLLIPCWWGLLLAILADPGGASLNDLWLAIAFATGAILMRGAGCTWNDINDRHLDAQVERTRSRPLPAGHVSVAVAAMWCALQLLLAFFVLLTFNPFAILLGIAALVPATIYPFAKRFTWWPQLFLGIAFNWGVLLGWAAHAGTISLSAFVLYVAGISWTLFYDTIYAHQDRKDDVPAGNRSTALLFAENTKLWLAGFAVLAVVLMSVAIGLAMPEGAGSYRWGLVLTAVSGFALHLAWQLHRLDISRPSVCLNLFRSNRDAGLIPAGLLLFACLV